MTIKEASLFCKDGDWIESKNQSLSGIRLIQTGNIGVGVYLDKFSRAKYISEETFNKLECTEVFPGDIIVSRLPAPVGRACIVPDGLGRTIAAVDCTILRIDEKKFLKEYVLLYTETGQYKSQIEKFLAGSTRVRISRKNLESISIPQKNLETQKNIVSIIYKIKNIVELRKQQFSKLDQLVKSRFIEMFGDVYLNTMSWDEKDLESIADIVSGITKGRKVKNKKLKEVPYMAVSNVKDGYIDWSTVKKIDVTDEEISRYRLLKDDVLITEGGDPDKVGRGAIIKNPLENCIHQNHIFRVRLNKLIVLPVFFAEYLKHQKSKRYFLSCAKQTTGIASINMKQLKSLPVLLPPIKLQRQFSDFIQQVEKAKLSVKQSLDKLETLKKSLMQEYFG